MPNPPAGWLVPSFAQFEWLIATVHEMALKQEITMEKIAELVELSRQNVLADQQHNTVESAQNAALTSLSSNIGVLIDLVTEMRAALPTVEDQAMVAEVMANIGKSLSDTQAATARSLSQNVVIGDLARRATAASETETPPAPPAP